ncbi:MAG: ABC transporter permease [Gemmatimonadota bacterium]|nr:ABC transporter permease [Gemmatimonadota bacterium]MDE2985045.1 ABC transporter permease [Gemmatimonadota bacterium]
MRGAGKQVWAVLRREYVERVKTKGFIFSTIAIPLLMLGMIGLSAFMAMRSEQSQRRLALIDFTGQVGEEVARRMEATGYDLEIVGTQVGLEELDRRVLEGEIEAYVVLDDLTLQEGAFAYRSEDSPGRIRGALMESIVVETVLELRLSLTENTAGVRELLGGSHLNFERLGEEVSEVEEVSGIATGFAGAMILYIAMLLYGSFVLRSVLDEKRNRVVEVVISGVTPGRLMLGKILGVGCMGMTQLGIWAACAGLIGLLGVPMLAANIPEADLGQITEFLPGIGALVLLLVYFVLGFFLYSSLFAAVGAMCSTEEEAQQAQFPIMMLLIVPFMLQMFSLQGDAFAWMDWAALFPFFSPILMFPRAVSGAVAWWMVGMSLVFMVIAVGATAWVAGRIYRVGILMQGKRPTLRELARWIREA